MRKPCPGHALGALSLCCALTLSADLRAETPAAGMEEYEFSAAAFAPWKPAAAQFDRGAFRDAIAAYRRGALADADLLALRQSDPSVRAALEWAAIRSAKARLGSRRLAAFLTAHPDFPMRGWIARRLETALFDERAAGSAVLDRFAANPPETAAGRVLFARALAAVGRAPEADAQIRLAFRDNSVTPPIEAIILSEFGSAVTAVDLSFRAERLVHAGQMTDALRIASRLGPGEVVLMRALHAALTGSAEAAALAEQVPPKLRRRPSYLLARATLLRRANRLTEAAALWRRAPREGALIASAEDWWTERRVLARKLLDSGDPTRAYAVASGYGIGSDQIRIEAEFHAGWIALRFLKDAEAAEVHFSRAASFATTPISLARSFYWEGRAREAIGRDSARSSYERAALFSATYYGQLARERLGMTAMALRAERPDRAAGAAFEAGVSGRVIRLLLDEGARDLAVPLVLDGAKSLDPRQTAALAEIIAARRDANLLLMLAKAASQRGLAVDAYAFPLFGVPYFEPVAGSADRAIVAAVARQESAFDPQAISHAGARGLMQLMPATASATARLSGLPFALASLTGDPAANVRIGAAHLGHLLKSFGGSYALTFASYNAGPGRAKEWIAAYGDPRDPAVDVVDWIERIPITETRNYVQRVSENAAVYRLLFGDGDGRALSAELAGRRRVDPIATGTLSAPHDASPTSLGHGKPAVAEASAR